MLARKKKKEKPKQSTNANANVRSAADASSDKLGSLESGTQITIYGEEGDFYKFDYNGTKAYITKDAVNVGDAEEETTEDTEDTEEEETTTKEQTTTEEETTEEETTEGETSAEEEVVASESIIEISDDETDGINDIKETENDIDFTDATDSEVDKEVKVIKKYFIQ